MSFSSCKDHYGSPSNSIYALAIAPYVDLASGTDVPGITMDQLFASVFKSLNTTFPQMLDADLAVANAYNVGLVTYEGGQSFNPYNGINFTLKQQAQSDPRMYNFYQTMVQIWDQHVGSLFTFYALNDPFWGLLPSISSPGSPKWDGVMSAILPAGDANLDGVVDSKDQAIVAANQGMTGALVGTRRLQPRRRCQPDRPGDRREYKQVPLPTRASSRCRWARASSSTGRPAPPGRSPAPRASPPTTAASPPATRRRPKVRRSRSSRRLARSARPPATGSPATTS